MEVASPANPKDMNVNRDMVPLRIYSEGQLAEKQGFSNLPETQKELLNRFRIANLGCRAAARKDLFEACAVLSTSGQVAKNAYTETLMRCLSQALGKSPKLFGPNVEEISFDEAWLLRSVESAASKDWDSFEFLIGSRVPRSARRNLGSLLTGISEQFCQS